MTKPNEYRATYILSTDAPYRNTEASSKGAHAGEGTLHKGRVVWLQKDVETRNNDAQVSAYAEGVGLVLLASSSVEPVR